MKVAIIGSRMLNVEHLESYLPANTTEIVSGGAKGIDTCVRIFAQKHHLLLTEFFPEYHLYGRRAPLVRNNKIIDYCDEVIAFWDGSSHGTKYVIDECRKRNKKVTVYKLNLPLKMFNNL